MSATELPRAGEAAPSQTIVASSVRWTHIAPTLLIIWIISMFDKANMAIVQNNPSFLDEFGLVGQQARIGWITTAMFLAYGLCAPFWGYLVDRIGARRTAALSLLVWAATCFWSGLAGSYGALVWSRVILGFGEAALYPCTLALVARWFALRERGRATSFWWIGTMIGPMLMGLVVTYLILQFGWRGQFFALGALALILPLPMVWFLVRDTPRQHRAVDATEADFVAAGALAQNTDAPGRAIKAAGSAWARNPRFWLATAAISCNGIEYWGWSIWLPTYLRTQRGFSFAVSGYLTFVIFGFAVATILIVGHVSDRIFRRAPLAGAGWFVSAIFLMASALAPSPLWSVIFSICALCAQQVGIACAEMLVHSICPEDNMGASQGVRAFVVLTIGALSPLMMGAILQASGNNYVMAFGVLAAAVIVSAGCMVRLAREGF